MGNMDGAAATILVIALCCLPTGKRLAHWLQRPLNSLARRPALSIILAGLAMEHLRDWQGDATTLPPRLTYESVPRHGPTVRWCDIPVSRVWR